MALSDADVQKQVSLDRFFCQITKASSFRRRDQFQIDRIFLTFFKLDVFSSDQAYDGFH